MPKQTLLEILICYRKIATSKDFKVVLFPLQCEIILSLPLYALSVFLQYCLEILIYARSTLISAQAEKSAMKIKKYL